MIIFLGFDFNFQSDLGAVSSEIKGLQSKSMSLGVKLRNLKVKELHLKKYLYFLTHFSKPVILGS